MQKSICVETFSFSELLRFELKITILLEAESDLDELRITHHEPCWSSIADLNELNVKNQRGTSWNLWWRANRAIAVL